VTAQAQSQIVKVAGPAEGQPDDSALDSHTWLVLAASGGIPREPAPCIHIAGFSFCQQ